MNNGGPFCRLVRQQPNQNPLRTGKGAELIAKFIFPQMLPSLFDPDFFCRITYTLQPLLMLVEQPMPMQTAYFSLHCLSFLDIASIRHLV